MATIITREPEWALVYDWNEQVISVILRTRLDTLRENAYQVFPIPKPSYILDIYGLRLNLSSHRGFEELHVINTPPGFSDNGGRSNAPKSHRLTGQTYSTTSSAWPKVPASSIPDYIVPNASYSDYSIPDYSIPDYSSPNYFSPDYSSPDISISVARKLESSDSRLSSSIPSHDVHHSNVQSASDLSISATNILHAISDEIMRVYPSSTGWYDAAFTVRWELDQYLETELAFDPKPYERDMFDPVLTITGAGSAAYATTARSYVQREWPDSRVDLLHHLQDWARTRNHYYGESFVLKSCIYVLRSPTLFVFRQDSVSSIILAGHLY